MSCHQCWNVGPALFDALQKQCTMFDALQKQCTPSTVGELSNCDTVRCNTWEGRLISILMNMLKLNLFFCEGCFEISSENKIFSMDYLKPHHRAAVFHLQLLVQACTIVYNWVLERTSCHQGPERPPGLWGLIPGWGHQCTLPGTPGTLPMHTTTTRHTTNAHYHAYYQCTLPGTPGTLPGYNTSAKFHWNKFNI